MNNESGEKRRVSAGRESLQRYLVAIRQFDLLTTSGERRLAVASRSGLEGARSELVQRSLRLVVKIARSYRGGALGLDELIAEGNLDLIEAVRRFDPARNVRFASYAVWWIRKFMIAASHRGVAVATSPSPKAEIGEMMGCTRERVRQIERRALDRARRLIEAPRRG